MDHPKPTIGRVVHYVLAKGVVRPAIIVQVWPSEQGYVNMQVFTDGPNDDRHLLDGERSEYSPATNRTAPPASVIHRTSVAHDEDGAVGTWHWPARA